MCIHGTRECTRRWACDVGRAPGGGGTVPAREVGAGETRGGRVCESRWLGHRLVQPLGLGDGPMDPSP
jgi:hypothetical protein